MKKYYIVLPNGNKKWFDKLINAIAYTVDNSEFKYYHLYNWKGERINSYGKKISN